VFLIALKALAFGRSSKSLLITYQERLPYSVVHKNSGDHWIAWVDLEDFESIFEIP
jgi:hypothetical protein